MCNKCFEFLFRMIIIFSSSPQPYIYGIIDSCNSIKCMQIVLYFGQSYQILHNNTTLVKENQHKMSRMEKTNSVSLSLTFSFLDFVLNFFSILHQCSVDCYIYNQIFHILIITTSHDIFSLTSLLRCIGDHILHCLYL